MRVMRQVQQGSAEDKRRGVLLAVLFIWIPLAVLTVITGSVGGLIKTIIIGGSFVAVACVYGMWLRSRGAPAARTTHNPFSNEEGFGP